MRTWETSTVTQRTRTSWRRIAGSRLSKRESLEQRGAVMLALETIENFYGVLARRTAAWMVMERPPRQARSAAAVACAHGPAYP
jgi:hypothetical protein